MISRTDTLGNMGVLSPSEIGKLLKIPSPKVRGRIDEAYVELKKLLTELGGEKWI